MWEDDYCLDALRDMTHIPTHPTLEQYLVQNDDPLQRKSLVGQKGVKASQRTTPGLTEHAETCIRRVNIVAGSARAITVRQTKGKHGVCYNFHNHFSEEGRAWGWLQCSKPLSDKGKAWGWLQSSPFVDNVLLS